MKIQEILAVMHSEKTKYFRSGADDTNNMIGTIFTIWRLLIWRVKNIGIFKKLI